MSAKVCVKRINGALNIFFYIFLFSKSHKVNKELIYWHLKLERFGEMKRKQFLLIGRYSSTV